MVESVRRSRLFWAQPECSPAERSSSISRFLSRYIRGERKGVTRTFGARRPEEDWSAAEKNLSECRTGQGGDAADESRYLRSGSPCLCDVKQHVMVAGDLRNNGRSPVSRRFTATCFQLRAMGGVWICGLSRRVQLPFSAFPGPPDDDRPVQP